MNDGVRKLFHYYLRKICKDSKSANRMCANEESRIYTILSGPVWSIAQFDYYAQNECSINSWFSSHFSFSSRSFLISINDDDLWTHCLEECSMSQCEPLCHYSLSFIWLHFCFLSFFFFFFQFNPFRLTVSYALHSIWILDSIIQHRWHRHQHVN